MGFISQFAASRVASRLGAVRLSPDVELCDHPCMTRHRGYSGEFAVDLEAGVIRGRVVGTRDVITFQGATVEEARRAFVESVDDYLACCAERGEQPEKPYSGKVLLRISPELHRGLAIEAERAGVSFNAFVAAKLSDRAAMPG